MPKDDAAAGARPASTGEFRTSNEIRHGFLSGVSFTDKPVTFNIVDGQSLFEGDIVLDGRVTTIEQPGQLPAAAPAPQANVLTQPDGTVHEAGVIIPGAQFRWPRGIIPFEVDANLPAAQRTAVTNAINEWTSKTRLAFSARVATDTDFIHFAPGGGCSSAVGRQTGRQDITLGAGCGTGQATHEIGHAVGLWHEQSREDRNRFVSINWPNIDPAQRHNFDQHITDGDDVGGYDYGSIMHYPRTAFSINGQDTIVPTDTAAVIGQRNALSLSDTASVRSIYPSLQAPNDLTFRGDFTGDGRTDLLAYVPSRFNWWLGSAPTGSIQPRNMGSTQGFGQLADKRPMWVGRFSQAAHDEILFYAPGDSNWWLGSFNGNAATWAVVSNTRGFGQVWDGRPFWTGDFNGDGKTEVLFYFPGDDNWWMAAHNGTTFVWTFVGNTRGFGHAINDGRPFWTGDFNGDGKTEMLFYYPGDDNWWLGQFNGSALAWSSAGNTSGFGHKINDGRPFWTGRFSANRDQILFYYPGDDNWWLGDYRGNAFAWSLATNTSGFGHKINDGRPFWIGDFAGTGRSQVLFYYPGDRNWWLGSHDGTRMNWTSRGNTMGFGQIWDGRPFWQGRFVRPDRDSMVFYFPGDGNYWIGTDSGTHMDWSRFGDF